MDLAEKTVDGVFAIYIIAGALAEEVRNTTALEDYLLRETSGAAIEVKPKDSQWGVTRYEVTLYARNAELLNTAIERMQTALYTLESMRIAHRLQTTMFKAA